MTKINNGSALALASLRKAQTKAEIMEILASLTIILGAKSFQMIPALNCPISNKNELLEFGSFCDWHKEIYKSEQEAIIDPCRHNALTQCNPVKWRKVFLNAKGKKEREYINRLREEGIKDGINFPIHGPNGPVGILCFASENVIDIKSGDEDFLSLVAILAMQRIKQYLAKKYVIKPKSATLTDRETECLSWVLDGKTNWEIGVLMGVSARTVQFHISNCQAKLNATNRVQVAVKALVQGLVEPNFEANDFLEGEPTSFKEFRFEENNSDLEIKSKRPQHII
ncbi:MAG: autoinducer binding domain-containing protein [Caulobacterales bacterium]|nr:autoinducer binding domain-containing protein [Caulobacterales bacterium]MCA0371755.1 LuxR C-terminal-related transcriptional regulator [Pseudomonadota bacterium]